MPPQFLTEPMPTVGLSLVWTQVVFLLSGSTDRGRGDANLTEQAPTRQSLTIVSHGACLGASEMNSTQRASAPKPLRRTSLPLPHWRIPELSRARTRHVFAGLPAQSRDCVGLAPLLSASEPCIGSSTAPRILLTLERAVAPTDIGGALGVAFARLWRAEAVPT